jgi:hypothetical protein
MLVTYTGKYFNPIEPDPGLIDIRDIAHALAMKARFNGHCSQFYSVAQHSILVSEWGGVHKLEGLLHDAAEAYLPDVITPMKELIPGFKIWEYNINRAIFAALGLPVPTIHWPHEVKNIDTRLCATEGRALLPGWEDTHTPLPIKIVPVHWALAETMFLRRFKELMNK